MTLEEKALAQFDRLVGTGELLWKESTPLYVEQKPFNFEFRIASSLQSKPQNEDTKSTTNDEDATIFDEPNPDFNLGLFGAERKHQLSLNKFCVVRPQFVLHTVHYESQTDDLNGADLGAAWEALGAMGEGYMVIFNGGEDAGASVAHKHLQLIPKGRHIDGLSFTTAGDESIPLRVDGLPYQHAVVLLPSSVDSGALLQVYLTLLSRFDITPTDPHNMLLTSRWMMVIPRSKAWIDEIAGNAAAMIGMVWCNSEAQYDGWIRRGIPEVLGEFGRPW